LIFSAVISLGLKAADEIVVVVNANNPVVKMTRSEVIDLFMGRYVAFPDGTKAKAIDLEGDHIIKKQFYLDLVNLSIARVNSYWSRIKFTGRARPPISKENEAEVINEIKTSENAIGYISISAVNSNLKVVYKFNE
jgi:ABC-type phosphate transport system substrate-binding protein